MKKLISFSFCLFLCFSIACKRDKQLSQNNIRLGIQNLISGAVYPDPGSITYVAWGIKDTSGANVAIYNGSAQFFNDSTLSDSTEDVGAVSFGSITINTNVATYGTRDYQFSASDRTNGSNPSQWGTNVTFGIGGGSSTYSAFTQSMYVPEVIYLDGFTHSCTSILPQLSKSNPVTLTWNSDANNTTVAVVFMYDGAASYANNSSLSSSTYTTTVTTADNGSYSITTSDLAAYSVGSVVEIYVGRSNDMQVISNGKTVNVTAYTYSKLMFIIVS